ncbi:FBD-associated F-box protein [Trifolium repens]|nr:FBD-associated F-box protein [Trifolium repens]
MSRRKSDDIDRLSTLPDTVLCDILSFLPTRTSVATMSLVSRRWRHLWKDLQVFRFDIKNMSDKNFVFFVNAVLSLRRSRHIRKFHLSIEYHTDYEILDDSIKVWILAAVGPHLEEMSLTLSSGYVSTILPPSFFINCTNLVSLRLFGQIYMDDQHSSVYFPSPKKLYMHSDLMDSEVPFLSYCPRLETLDAYFTDGYSMTKVFAQLSSNSKSLNFTSDNLTWTYLAFEIIGGFLRLGIISYFQSMAEAFVHVFPRDESEFVNPLLQKLQYSTDVDLISSHSTSKWPIHAPAPVLNCPEFRNLHHLKFILPRFNSNLLLNVLEKCHMLRVLIIQSNKEKPSPLRTWEPHSTKIPKCFKSQLTYIHIEGYQGFEDELTFAEYILRNGLVLETMLIFVDTSVDITNKSRSIKRLTNITKGSIRCQLKFDPYGST